MGSELSVKAPGGRTLDVYLDGPGAGIPLLFHSGTPSSGGLYAPFVGAAAARGLRMIGFSRAGYGGSTRAPGRSVADVTDDVAAILDALDAPRFYTLGWSGGGPHALACAALLPERMIGACTVGSPAPYGADGLDWLAGMNVQNVMAFNAALAGEDELAAVADQVAAAMSSITPDGVIASLAAIAPEVDRAAVTCEAAAWFAENFRESVRNGPWGWFDDQRALVSPWGFDVAAIRVPVATWQGAQDRMTPFAHGAWLASHVPGARAHLLREHGHISLGVASFGELLDDLLAIAPS